MPFFHRAGSPAWIIAGLGNPGRAYACTRHNAGYLCLDMLADQCGAKVDRLKFRALTGLAKVEGQSCLLMKPLTHMNNSGLAVAEAARFYKLPPERVLVLVDDTNFLPGKLRIRQKGSAGGHNGVKSIIAHLGTEMFPRIKLGVGAKPDAETDLVDWVLGEMPEEDRRLLRSACEEACGAIREQVK
ncbi:MAG: aminoacyl-tRNA hydrolase [Oscillospiraceae bacterium]|jgi:PTH1 family peptidyl-tRNA hydrolase|nr:aminoacyl-tRNA hydrolase [Oscillospiraceae bacterium]